MKRFSGDIESDLKLLGSFSQVQEFFDEAVREKEQILEAKAKNFIPNATEELRGILSLYLEKVQKRIQILEKNDKEELQEQKKLVENQIGNIRADMAALFRGMECETGNGEE